MSDATRLRYHIGTVTNTVFAEMYRRPATAAGGSLLAAELLRQGGCVFNPGGGTHHGMPDRANGFCYLNDPVLAMLAMRRQGLERIAYVDIDAHHCDGVEAAFSGQEGMLLISTHEERRWPFTGALTDRAGGVSLNIPLPKGTNDSEFEAILTRNFACGGAPPARGDCLAMRRRRRSRRPAVAACSVQHGALVCCFGIENDDAKAVGAGWRRL